jgi:hypothetical protein
VPGRGHAERALQASWRQEHGAAHDGGPRAQQASKLETRALFAGSQGGTVARPSGNTCAPGSVRRGLKAPAVPRSDTDHGTIYLTGIDANGKVAEARRGFRVRMRSHRRALKSIEAVKIRRIGRREWMWRLAAGAE